MIISFGITQIVLLTRVLMCRVTSRAHRALGYSFKISGEDRDFNYSKFSKIGQKSLFKIYPVRHFSLVYLFFSLCKTIYDNHGADAGPGSVFRTPILAENLKVGYLQTEGNVLHGDPTAQLFFSRSVPVLLFKSRFCKAALIDSAARSSPFLVQLLVLSEAVQKQEHHRSLLTGLCVFFAKTLSRASPKTKPLCKPGPEK